VWDSIIFPPPGDVQAKKIDARNVEDGQRRSYAGSAVPGVYEVVKCRQDEREDYNAVQPDICPHVAAFSINSWIVHR
jgi:hypothetical protein